MVLFILVYFVATAWAKIPELSDMTASKIEMSTNNTVQYLQFDDISFNLTDFTICAWVKFSNFTQTQTIFRLTTEHGKSSAMLWRVHARPKETTMRMTINNRLVASENIRLTRGQWTHVCFQWKGLTGVWAMFINAKIHSVGQTDAIAKNDTMISAAWKLRGKGAGIVGDDSAPCRNVWQAYGLYLTGSAGIAKGTETAARTVLVDGAKTGGKSSTNVTNAAGKTSSSNAGKVKNNNKRQAVYDSDLDEQPVGGTEGTGSSKPFQWFTKTFAFIKRMFTFVIIPFFKFVRNTFFQTRSLDDTVVDVSETHLTISEVKFTPPQTTTTVAMMTTMTTTTTVATGSLVDDSLENVDGDKKNKRHAQSSSSKTETNEGDVDDRCDNAATVDHLVTAADLLDAGGPLAVTDDTLSPNAKRYLRIVSDGLNDVGVNVAFVKRAFACCHRRLLEPQTDVIVINWDQTRARAYNVTTSPHVCGRF